MHAVLEVGGTHAVAAIVDAENRQVLMAHKLVLDSQAPAGVILETLARTVEGLGEHVSGLPLVVAIPGPFDYERGIGDFEGVAKFGALRGVEIGTFLTRRLGMQVSFVNDVTAFGLGQYLLLGQPRRLVALTLGTGVGSVFLEDGCPVIDGPAVPPLGWIYLLEHDGRPIEESFSRRALVDAYAAATGRQLDVRGIAARARRRDMEACRVMEQGLTALADTVAPWVARFEADLVVVGGSIVGSWDLLGIWFTPRLAELLPASDVAVPVENGAAQPDAALIGAAHHLRMLSA